MANEISVAFNGVDNVSKVASSIADKMRAFGSAVDRAGQIGGVALGQIAAGMEYARAKAERLGRTDVTKAFDGMAEAGARLTDQLVQIPFSVEDLGMSFDGLNLVLGLFGQQVDATKKRDLLGWFTDAADGAKNLANVGSALAIKLQLATGAITEEQAAAKAAALATDSFAKSAEKAAHSTDKAVYAFNQVGEPLDAIKAKAIAAAGAVDDLRTTGVGVSAGISGSVADAQQAYNDKLKETGPQLEKLRAELAKYEKSHGQVARVVKESEISATEYAIAQRNLSDAQSKLAANTDPSKQLDLALAFEKAQKSAGDANEKLGYQKDIVLDNSKKVKDLKGQIAELEAAEAAAAAAAELATKQLIFQSAAASLDSAAQLELGRQLGLISEKDYAIAKAAADAAAAGEKQKLATDELAESIRNAADAAAELADMRTTFVLDASGALVSLDEILTKIRNIPPEVKITVRTSRVGGDIDAGVPES